MKNKIINEKINSEQLKEAMRAWITGVAIVTGHYDGLKHGMTANSFNSIALNPPTVMVALRQLTRTQHLINKGKTFAVTILETGQISLAKRFAGQTSINQDRFVGVETFSMVTGAPLIKGGIAFFDCQVAHSFDVGGTTVFVGEVLAAKNERHDRDPLLYFNREWRRLAE